jgi:hypothetical protein
MDDAKRQSLMAELEDLTRKNTQGHSICDRDYSARARVVKIRGLLQIPGPSLDEMEKEVTDRMAKAMKKNA